MHSLHICRGAAAAWRASTEQDTETRWDGDCCTKVMMLSLDKSQVVELLDAQHQYLHLWAGLQLGPIGLPPSKGVGVVPVYPVLNDAAGQHSSLTCRAL